jgi:hypothetical protein
VQVLSDLPKAFVRYQQIGGVLDFAIFHDAEGGDAEAVAAMAQCVPGWRAHKAAALAPRPIAWSAFLGDWCDAATGALMKLGSYTTSDGRMLLDPALTDLQGLRIVNGGGQIPEIGTGGFAYAFSSPPYGLQAEPDKVQGLFAAICEHIRPAGLEHRIIDWSSPRLAEVSDYFKAGLEWWGVFLFSIHVPARRQLTVIFGSTTD